MRRTLFLLVPMLIAMLLHASCHSGHSLELANKTGVPLTYCPVLTDPPPPHRVVSDRLDQPGVIAEIDTDDFNPVFWDPVSNLGIQIQIGLSDDPAMILVRVLQYVVPPGQEGNDPAQQPTLVAEYPYEVDPDQGSNLRITAGVIAQQIPIQITQS